MKKYYGAISKNEIIDITSEVVRILGGGENAIKLVLETIATESSMGTLKVKPRYNFGVGLTQFDLPGFNDTKARTSKEKKDLIIKEFNIDINQVELRDLAYSPLLSIIFCRLFYQLRPGVIPSTVEERGKYWKKWYNTELGKGTVEHYLKQVKEFL